MKGKRDKIARYLEYIATINDELEGEIVGNKGWHAHIALQFRRIADEVRSGHAERMSKRHTREDK